MYDNQNAKSATVPPTRPAVLKSLDDLEKLVAELRETVDNLEDRLACILESVPANNQEATKGLIVGEGTGIAHRIQARYTSINHIVNKLNRIMSRLEV